MIAVEEFLQPISEDNPSGTNVKNPLYDVIKEARRADDENLGQGAWASERKIANYGDVIKVSTDALKSKSKDLFLAAYLTDALLRKEGYAGLDMGLKLIQGLISKFWPTVYPQIDEEEGLGLRVAPLEWICNYLADPVKNGDPLRNVPLNRAGHGFIQYKESRLVPYEEKVKNDKELKKKRDLLVDKEKKLPPEEFDSAFNDTPGVFYLNLEKSISTSIATVDALSAVCDEKFGDESPSFRNIKTALEEVKQVAGSLLAQKKAKDPTLGVEPKAPEPAPGGDQTAPNGAPGVPTDDGSAYRASGGGPGISFNLQTTESPARKGLVESVAAAAATLRHAEPTNPAPYLMMRGLRWGDLRAAAALDDPAMLEAPPTEVRQQIKQLSQAQKWQELLDTVEKLMAHPCSRAWLDLQRFAVEACVALGSDYDAIAVAIRSELRCLLRDVPQLLDATLMDDTPTANAKTREWIKEIMAEPGGAPPPAAVTASIPLEEPPAQRWQKKFLDSSILAKEAMRAGQAEKAIDIMNQELARQRSARARFQRRIQFVEICQSAEKSDIVQPMLEEMMATIDNHKLEEWEDKSYIASALVTIFNNYKKVDKQKVYDRICKLDPPQALNLKVK
jgi:type VI secretion system protein ImpA